MKTKLLLLLLLANFSIYAQTANVPAYVPKNGLIAYYPFNGNANDESGNTNNGIINGASLTPDRLGNANSAYNFDGLTNYIDATISQIPQNNSARTISGWFKSNAPNFSDNNEACIFNYGTLSKLQRLSLCIYSKGYLETVNGPDFTSDDFYVNNFDYLNNDWYFFTLTYDGNKVSLYVNGLYVSEKTVSLNTVNNLFRIGKRISGDSINEYFKGTIDDIGIWNRVLTPEEISALYTPGKPEILYTLIPDSNFEQKLIDLGIDTDGLNGKVLTSNISTVKLLALAKSNISDLTGIQDFISLTDLYCGQNSLTTLNVSKNTALTTLDCNNNKITSLDVSNNIALLTLSCYANQLTALDVKVNTALTKLDSGSNQYTALDVSSNTALTFLGCNTSQLTSLDVSKNTALNLLDCRENKLTHLDVSKIATLTELYCQSNQLTNVDVSKNKALEFLNSSKNQLTTLDVSVNTALVGLYANSNQLTSLNLKNANNVKIAYLNLIDNPNLSCIQVDDSNYFNTNWADKKDKNANYNVNCTSYTQIPDSNFEQKLIDLGIDTDGLNGKISTADISSITSLDLSDSNITDLSGIENFTGLKYFFCNTNKITSVDFSKNILLENLDVKENNLTSLNVSKNTKLRNLEFAQNQISSIDLSQNTNLLGVGFNFNKITEIDLTNNNLEELHCRGNNLTTINLINQTNLILLEIGLNKIASLDLTANKKLEELECASMGLKTLNVSENKELVLINAFGNELTSFDVSQNPKLKALYIEFNPLESLNIQNGNNENFILPAETGKKSSSDVYTSFLGNTKLSCIKVDDVAFSNAKWSKIKEPNTTYSTTCKNLGIEDTIFDKAVVYPNPTKGEVTISNITLDKATVYNTLGQLVRSFTLNSDSTNTINLSGLPKGVYYVYLINQDAASVKKVIVE